MVQSYNWQGSLSGSAEIHIFNKKKVVLIIITLDQQISIKYKLLILLTFLKENTQVIEKVYIKCLVE